jgi:predicted AlkP superfamily pyrophosphatase or phosphodiesterase
MRKIFCFFSLILVTGILHSQKLSPQPKLVVGIVVDQMRYDFLYRYWNKYSEGGFKYLVKNGRSFENMHYNYVPTYTGPGHAAIYTGTSPAYNGIVANEWYDRKSDTVMYVVQDDKVSTIGSNSVNGKMSPNNLLTTTITDELKMFTNGKSKVVGIAIKDRGAILPAGNMADAAYWHDPTVGSWISSSFYLQALPQYVIDFNSKRLSDQYLNQVWNPLLPIEQYTESTADDTRYELKFKGETKPVFPHDLKLLKSQYNYSLLNRTPFGNSFTTDFALEVLQKEEMGKDEITDFLALSYSSTDYVGHQFGINAIETEDTYIRLDLEIKRLIEYLNKNVGKGNFTVFLTADHGVLPSPPYLEDRKIHTGGFEITRYTTELKEYLKKELGEGKWVSYYANQQVYLNRDLIKTKKLELEVVQDMVVEFTRNFNGVKEVVPAYYLSTVMFGNEMLQKLQRGYDYKRCGDVLIVLEPQWIDDENAMKGGTTHGSSYTYDTHVPFLIMGAGINKGLTNQEAYITDIAPTLANYLRIMEPSGCTGKILDLK